MNSSITSQISSTTVRTLKKARSAIDLLPKVVGKPTIFRRCIFKAHIAQVILIISLLLMPAIIPEFIDMLVNKISPPTTGQKLSNFFKGLQQVPSLDHYQVTIRATLWSVSSLIILFLFLLYVPRAVRESRALSETNEKQADQFLGTHPSQSIILYQSALAMTIDHKREIALNEKLQQAKIQAIPSQPKVSDSPSITETVVHVANHSSRNKPLINNRYRIKSELGRGAMGVVYVAHDTTLERDVALKQLAPQLTQDQQFVKRFQREAKALAKLSHPNIVHIFDYIEADEQIWIAMELVKGIELTERLSENKPLPLEESYSLALQMSQALLYAHNQGVVHRDFKPANILITANGTIKVMDFGLAMVSQSSSLTQLGTVMGSVAYMSPEQATGKPCDNKTDIYALGVVLFFMLTGKLPFNGDAQSVVAQHLSQTPPVPQQLNPNIPLALNDLILQMLEKSADDRPPSMAEISQELELLPSSTNNH